MKLNIPLLPTDGGASMKLSATQANFQLGCTLALKAKSFDTSSS